MAWLDGNLSYFCSPDNMGGGYHKLQNMVDKRFDMADDEEREAGPIPRLKSLGKSMTRRRKGLVRISLLLIAAGVIAAIAAAFGIAQNYGYLRASILTGAPEGRYYALGTRLADRAKRVHGRLSVIPTAGSIENVSRFTAAARRCSEMFALIHDATPVPVDAGIELLGRLPEPESLLLLGNRSHTIPSLRILSGTIRPAYPVFTVRTSYLHSDKLEDSLAPNGIKKVARCVNSSARSRDK